MSKYVFYTHVTLLMTFRAKNNYFQIESGANISCIYVPFHQDGNDQWPAEGRCTVNPVKCARPPPPLSSDG